MIMRSVVLENVSTNLILCIYLTNMKPHFAENDVIFNFPVYPHAKAVPVPGEFHSQLKTLSAGLHQKNGGDGKPEN